MSAWVNAEAQGKFRWDGFEPGPYRLRVSLTSDKGTSYRCSQTIEVLGERTLEPNLNHRTGPLTDKGKATAFSNIRAMTESDAKDDYAYYLPSVGAIATPDGTFELTGLFPGTYTIPSSSRSWRGPVTKTLAVTEWTELDLIPPPIIFPVVAKKRCRPNGQRFPAIPRFQRIIRCRQPHDAWLKTSIDVSRFSVSDPTTHAADISSGQCRYARPLAMLHLASGHSCSKTSVVVGRISILASDSSSLSTSITSKTVSRISGSFFAIAFNSWPTILGRAAAASAIF